MSYNRMNTGNTLVESLLQRPVEGLESFKHKYLGGMKVAEEALGRLCSKSPVSSDVYRYIQRLILTQERLFKQITNVADRLAEFVKNPLTPQEKALRAKQNYEKANELYLENEWKEARYYIDKNQHYLEDNDQEYQNKHCLLKGEILHALREPELSNYYLERSSLLERNDPEIFYSIGLNYLTMGDKEKKTRGRKSKKSKMKVRVSQSHFKASKEINREYIMKAAQYLKRAIELKPEEYNKYDDICDAFKLLGSTKSYIQFKEKQQSVSQDSSKLYFSYLSLARYLNSIDERRECISIYSKTLNLPIDPEQKLSLISQVVEIIESGQNNHHQIIPYLQESIRIIRAKSPSDQLIYHLNFYKLAKCYSRSSLYDKELEMYLHLYQIKESLNHTQPLDIYKDIGICYYRLSQWEMAEKYLLLYLSKNKFKSEVYLLLEDIYGKQEDYFAAKDILLKLQAIDNTKEVVERLLRLEKEIGTESGVSKLEQELRLFETSTK